MQKTEILWRLDDRLIHGQVVIGWCGQLPIRTLIVCDDQIATSDWEKELLLMAAPQNLPTYILNTGETAARIKSGKLGNSLCMVLLKSLDSLQKLVSLGTPVSKVTIGGIHFSNDRKQVLPYVFLSLEEILVIRDFINKGIRFECQDLPGATPYNLEKLIGKNR